MGLGDSYATLAEIRSRVGITDAADTADDARLTAALTTASRGIEHETVCGRQFNDAGTASARVYTVDGADLALVDDFSTTTGLVVKTDTAGDGTYATSWASSDYQLEPLNGIVSGMTGWPYWRIRAVGSRRFVPSARATLQVTARWGWSAVPAPVKEACLIVATEIGKLKDAPFGVAGFGEYGAIRVRQNPIAMGMLAPYRRSPVLVG